LKRNAAKAQDPKALFQAMRPVFSDLQNEVEKSLKFYSNFDKTAKIGKIVAAGNAVKLPGLQRYLTQYLGFDVAKLESYRGLTGPGVIDAPPFKENMLSYGVCYGLALQGLEQSRLRTNLLPREIIQFRKIRAKKPWVLTAVALLLIALTLNYWKHFSAMQTAMHEGAEGFARPVSASQSLVTEARKYKEEYDQAKEEFKRTDRIGKSFLQNVQGRRLWLEMMYVLNACLPRNDSQNPIKPDDVTTRRDVKITSIECRRFDNLADWFQPDISQRFDEGLVALGKKKAPQPEGEVPAEAPADAPAVAMTTASALEGPPEGAGWVFELRAHHFFNHRDVPDDQGMNYLRRTLLRDLFDKDITLSAEEAVRWGFRKPKRPSDPDPGPFTFRPSQVGLKFPVLIDIGAIDWTNEIDVEDPNVKVAPNQPAARKRIKAPRYEVIIQFVWQEVLPEARSTTPEAGDAVALGR
jgi:type IV pilus assembly protein PilM